ncbi:MAG TPA: aldose 1-epimerase [Meiothermus sp.]|nr:aldose 1-epimerase [Meiothermus sp.]
MLAKIENEALRLEVNPGLGASPAAFQAKIQGEWADILRPTPRPLPEKSSLYSSFILAPYSNRIRAAKFGFAGQEYQLEANTPQGNAQHGDVRNRPWQVHYPEANTLECTFDSRDFTDLNWPWPFTMRVVYSLREHRFATELELTNTGDSPMPAGFGLHPYFVRRLPGSIRDAVLDFHADGVYLTDESLIPTDGMKPIPPELDFSQAQSLEGQQVDAVFGGWDGRVVLEWPGANVRLVMETSFRGDSRVVDPVFGHLVVFTAPDGTLALEPVSHVTDGFNLLARGVPDTGVRVLGPGESLQGTVRITLEGL